MSDNLYPENQENENKTEESSEPVSDKNTENESSQTGFDNSAFNMNGFGSPQNFDQKPPKKNKTAIIIVSVIIGYFMLMGIAAMVIFGSSYIKKNSNSNGTVSQEQTEEKPNVQNPEINMTTNEKGNEHIQNEEYTGDVLKASEIYNNNVNSIVFVETTLNNGIASGTGFVIDSKNGYILTNYHVVQGGNSIKVQLYNEETYDATLVGGDSVNDVAVLQITAKDLKSITTGNSDEVNVGDDIIVIGHPLGNLKYTLTKGVVSAHGRMVDTGDSYEINMFQIDAAANEGNSGGPAFDATGAVVGIVSAKYASVGVEGIVFCIPINDALSVAKSLVDYGYVKGRSNFGITVSTSSGYLITRDPYGKQTTVQVPQGARIESVYKGTCADKAGLKKGDIIVEIGGTVVSSSSDLLRAKQKYKAGETVELKIYRDSDYMTVKVTFDEYKPE